MFADLIMVTVLALLHFYREENRYKVCPFQGYLECFSLQPQGLSIFERVAIYQLHRHGHCSLLAPFLLLTTSHLYR